MEGNGGEKRGGGREGRRKRGKEEEKGGGREGRRKREEEEESGGGGNEEIKLKERAHVRLTGEGRKGGRGEVRGREGR